MEEKNKKRQIAKISVFITSIFVIFMSVTYAFISQTLAGTKEVVISAGVLDLVLEEENEITISDALPMYDEVGMIQEPFMFKLVNNTNNSVNYKIRLLVTETEVETDQMCSDLGEITTSSPSNCRKNGYSNNLRNEALNLCREEFDESVTTERECLTAIQNMGAPYTKFEELIDFFIEIGFLEDTRTLIETYPNNMITTKIEMLEDTFLRYGLTKNGENTIDELSNTLQNEEGIGLIDSGVIQGNETINYSLRIWIKDDVTSDEDIFGKSISYKLFVDVEQEKQWVTGEVSEIAFDESLIGDNCKIYNDGVETYLVGECSQNYVWYSGKLWRIVSRDNTTGSVKMVTDGSITNIEYDDDTNSAEFENSEMSQWLNQEFLPTLHDSNNYLVTNSEWYKKENSNSNLPAVPSANKKDLSNLKPTQLNNYNSEAKVTPLSLSYTLFRPTGEKIVSTIGLLSAYDYYVTVNMSDGLSTKETGYLNNGTNWYLFTANDRSEHLVVSHSGNLYSVRGSAFSVRPAVNLKSVIKTVSGKGSRKEPYILEGDVNEPVNGTTLLSTRYSGEYISFNNEIYRIVDTKDGLTKITAVNNIEFIGNAQFHSTIQNPTTNFANSDIKQILEDYYQELKTINITAYNMIEPNTNWYLGIVDTNGSYKSAICAEVDPTKSMNECEEKTPSTPTTIGLPRYGEIFTSQITRGIKNTFWTLTLIGENTAAFVNDEGYTYGDKLSNLNGVRPSMYLKSNVVIASNNRGNGTYEKPYKIELGQ